MVTYPQTYISAFSGIGALDLAVKRVFPDARTLCYIEHDVAASARLVSRMEDGRLDEAPIWSDVATFPGEMFQSRADMVVGGFPCQDISQAGKRRVGQAGIHGKRSGLFFRLLDVVCNVGANYLFMENVEYITNEGLDIVTAELAQSGFDAEWGCLRAYCAGGQHRRNRWWCLAWRRSAIRSTNTAQIEATRETGALGNGRSTRRQAINVTDDAQSRRTTAFSASDLDDYVLANDDRWPIRAPGYINHQQWERIFKQWGFLAPAIIGPLRRMVDGAPVGVDVCLCDKRERIHEVGNSIDVACGEAALRLLWQRAFSESIV